MLWRKEKPDQDGYYATAIAVGELEEGQMAQVKVGARRVVVARVEGELYAFDDTCPHGAASLGDGQLAGRQVCCPQHGYCFDVRSGALRWPEDEPYRLRRYELKVEGGQVKVKLE